MKHLLFVVSLICSLGAQAQLTNISVETFVVHDGIIISELDGFTTYHVYANTSDSTDFVSSVFGDSENELIFSSTGTVFQSNPGFAFGNEPNSALFSVLPILLSPPLSAAVIMPIVSQLSNSNNGITLNKAELGSFPKVKLGFD